MTRTKSGKPMPETSAADRATDVHTVIGTEFDRHLIVTAGAGTGKTSLLIARYVALLRQGRATVDRIVAITFTEKAAAEIRRRLRQELDACWRDAPEAERPQWAQAIEDLDKAPINTIHGFAAMLLKEYPVEAGIDPGAVVEDEQQSLVRFEQAWGEWIGRELSGESTIWREILRGHSLWAVRELAALLYRHREVVDDEGLSIGDALEVVGELMPGLRAAASELRLAMAGCRRCDEDPMGKKAPELLGLAQQALTLADGLGVGSGLGQASESVSAESDQASPHRLVRPTVAHLRSADGRRSSLAEGSGHHGRSRPSGRASKPDPTQPGSSLPSQESMEEFITWCEGLTERHRGQGKSWKGRWESEEAFTQAREAFNRLVERLNELKRWGEDALLHQRTVLAIEQLRRFIAFCQDQKRADGVLDFDDLLQRARNLLLQHPEVRRRCQEQYRYLLVDEFQDTDPLQAEIILYLAEAKPLATDWQQVQLDPGKLFLVGDPKQSIYGWRKANLATYEAVVARVAEQGVRALTLERNYRSEPQIVGFVNECFGAGRLITEERPYQPPYLALMADRAAAGDVARVETLLVASDDDDEALSALESRRIEALALAERIERLVRDRLPGVDELNYGKIAILFRSLSNLEIYEEALRSAGVPYLVLGGRGYYRRPEVTDLLNLLRLLDNAEDRLSLVGVLRSPIIGMTDRQILEIAEAGAWHYDQPLPEGLSCGQALEIAYGMLRELAALRHRLRVADLLEEIVARTSWLQVLAALLDGEQQVANIRKLIKTAARLDEGGALTLKRWIGMLAELATGEDREGDSPLAEEGTNAVRLMTIHKAKGLEFDIVIVPDAQRGLGRGGGGAELFVDRGGGRWGVNAAGLRTIGWRRGLADMAQHQAMAEERRLLYVALTRARECVIISGGLTKRREESFLAWLGEAMGVEWAEVAPGEWRRGEGRAVIARVASNEPTPKPRPMTVEQLLAVEPDVAGLEVLAAAEAERAAEYRSAQEPSRGRIAPVTALAKGETPDMRHETRDTRRESQVSSLKSQVSALAEWTDAEIARRTGILVHETLEHLDFARTDGWERWLQARLAAEADLSPDDRQRLLTESRQLVERFLASAFAQRLRRAQRLEREVPVLHREPSGVVADGRIDLMFEEEGTLYLVDYKTDRQIAEDLGSYRAQLSYYREAVEAILARPVRTALYYIRHDKWVDVA